jgi:hypothetical protein
MADKDEVARRLAEMHYRTEAGITQIFRITQKVEVEITPAEPIKLLEVNKHTIASGILPLGFDPAPANGIPFPSVIVEVTPAEFEKI